MHNPDSSNLYNATLQGPPVPRDMRYNLFNLERQRKNYESMKAVAGKDILNDVYARDPESDTFWFVGKDARVSGASIYPCISPVNFAIIILQFMKLYV